jgi:hypothetical protein
MSKKACFNKYNSKWEKEFPWLEAVPGNVNLASCKYCRTVVKAKLDVVKAHGNGQKHKCRLQFANENVKSKLPFKPVTVKVIPSEVKKVELKLTAMAVCHTSFNALNHISDLVCQEGKGSHLEKIKLHRTKEIISLDKIT